MTKRELINQVAQDAGVTATQANGVISALINSITDEVQSGGKLTLTGFGTFSLAERAARKGRNPQTGESNRHPGREIFQVQSQLGSERNVQFHQKITHRI